MSQVRVFTSAALNYIPKVRLLFQSLRGHHPEWELHLALADELPADMDLSAEPFDFVTPISDLQIEAWRPWAFCHAIVELATAIKPFMLSRLLAMPDTAKVIYLDPDMVVFSRLDDILDALDEANVALTPHQTRPEIGLVAVMDNEISSLRHGIYNLGFLGVAATDTGRAIAQWWGDRVYYFCRDDIPHGLFTDQRWMDLVPALFPGIAIMRSSRHNVATWNLTTRELIRDESGQYLVDGQPLGFYHFTGFDSGAHRLMATKNIPDNEALESLITWYQDEMHKQESDPLCNTPWAFATFSDGKPITRPQRIVYRERADLQASFPDPFDASGYAEWWKRTAKSEYPGLFDGSNEKAELARLTAILRPGYGGQAQRIDWDRTRSLLGQAVGNPEIAARLAKRAWEILRTEGFQGVRHRLGS